MRLKYKDGEEQIKDIVAPGAVSNRPEYAVEAEETQIESEKRRIKKGVTQESQAVLIAIIKRLSPEKEQ
jgi:hypothetical protein